MSRIYFLGFEHSSKLKVIIGQRDEGVNITHICSLDWTEMSGGKISQTVVRLPLVVCRKSPTYIYFLTTRSLKLSLNYVFVLLEKEGQKLKSAIRLQAYRV